MTDEKMKRIESRLKVLENGSKDLQKGLSEISEIKEDIKQIKHFILGDKEFEQDGLLREHKDMYDVYKDFKPDLLTIKEMTTSFRNERFLKKYFAQIVTGVGVANIITFIIYVLTFISNIIKH